MIDLIQGAGALLAVIALAVMIDREQHRLVRVPLAICAACLMMLGANDVAVWADLSDHLGFRARESIRAVLYWSILGVSLGRMVTMQNRSEPRVWWGEQERSK